MAIDKHQVNLVPVIPESEDVMSGSVLLTSGVPQGSIMGPMLLSLCRLLLGCRFCSQLSGLVGDMEV